jgi:hypothetical protein
VDGMNWRLEINKQSRAFCCRYHCKIILIGGERSGLADLEQYFRNGVSLPMGRILFSPKIQYA